MRFSLKILLFSRSKGIQHPGFGSCCFGLCFVALFCGLIRLVDDPFVFVSFFLKNIIRDKYIHRNTLAKHPVLFFKIPMVLPYATL